MWQTPLSPPVGSLWLGWPSLLLCLPSSAPHEVTGIGNLDYAPLGHAQILRGISEPGSPAPRPHRDLLRTRGEQGRRPRCI